MKCILKLSILWAAISVSFASSLDPVSPNDPKPAAKAAESQPKPFYILGMPPAEFRSLVDSDSCLINYEVSDPKCMRLRMQCNESGVQIIIARFEGEQPFQEPLNGFLML